MYETGLYRSSPGVFILTHERSPMASYCGDSGSVLESPESPAESADTISVDKLNGSRLIWLGLGRLGRKEHYLIHIITQDQEMQKGL